jgi:5-methylcytosine-specific restriction endonuclease McrA
MKLHNPFSEDTRNIYLYQYACMDCGRSDQGLELHHIRSRISNSPLNSYLICMVCHSKIGHTQEEEARYLQQTLRWLLSQQYELTQKDVDFYSENKKLYLLEL